MKKLIALTLSLFAFGASHAAVQTVGWYKEHATERKAMNAKCRDNPGELRNDPNCINAARAEEEVRAAAGVRREADQVKQARQALADAFK